MAVVTGVRKVLRIALLSRAFGILMQSFSNYMIVDYDTSEEHLACSVSSDQNSAQNNTVNLIVSSMLGGFSKWDSVYFLDIATHGYRFEQNMAFFPLFPTLLYTFSLTLQPFKLILNLTDKSLLLLASTFLNTLSFVVASMGLFCLTNSLFKNPKLAKNVVVLFCVNPSSVFFTATYSESVFAMTQFWGMFFVERNELFIASLIFSLGSATRSNGVISCGFICYTALKNITIPYRDAKSKDRITSLKAIARNLMKTFMFLAIILLPFVIFQGYGYYIFCKNPLQKLKSVWCDDSVPLPYRYIQKHYWNVGFLNYYEIKQIPNFLLVLPIIVMSVWGIREYLIQQRRENVWTLGLLMPDKNNILNIFVYTVHLLFLVVFGVTSMHVQVATRMILSSSPMIYWIAISWLTPKRPHDTNVHLNRKAHFVCAYFSLYYCLGYLLHCNFYPWT